MLDIFITIYNPISYYTINKGDNMSKQYKDRKSIPEEYKWDLEGILEGKSREDWIQSKLEEIKSYVPDLNNRFESKERFLKAMIAELKKLDAETEVSWYLINNEMVNVVDSEIAGLRQKFDFELYKINMDIEPFDQKLKENVELVKEWKQLPEFKHWAKYMDDMIDEVEHGISEEVEEFRKTEGQADSNLSSIFEKITSSELDFGTLTLPSGKEVNLDQAKIVKYSKHKDESVRKQAYQANRDAYYKHRESLSFLLHEEYKKHVAWSKIKKYNSPSEYLMSSNKVTDEQLLSLISSAKKNSVMLKEYKSIWRRNYKKVFGTAPKKWDGSRELVKVKSNKVTVEEAKEMVLDALSVYGEEYVSVLKKAMNEKWIDYMPVHGKTGGAYSYGIPTVERKVILMNFFGNLDDASTLAHELGHTLHSYYSHKYNEMPYQEYPGLMAETASTFNEILFADYLIENTNDPKVKYKVIEGLLGVMNSNAYMAAMDAAYEYEMLKGINEGKPLNNFEAISTLWKEIAIDFNQAKASSKNEDLVQSFNVPHYYMSFYLYQYSFGILAALIFYARYKKHGKAFLDEYVENFLKKGGQYSAADLLKLNGIDLTDPTAYDEGFKVIKEKINQLKEISKEIF